MKRSDLKSRLHTYLVNTPGWHKKVSLYVIADGLGFSPESGARKLRELAEEGKIKVEYYKGKYAKNLAKYTADEIPVENRIEVVEREDGTKVAIMK